MNKEIMGVVQLGYKEMFQGAMIGVLRRLESIFKNYKDRYGAKNEDGWAYNIDGAIGEVALSKFTGLNWAVGNRLSEPDVGGYGVRTVSANYPRLCLRIYPDDADDRRFYLVTPGDSRNEYIIHGWLTGREGKQERYWGDPFHTGRPPTFFVPSTDLHREK